MAELHEGEIRLISVHPKNGDDDIFLSKQHIHSLPVINASIPATDCPKKEEAVKSNYQSKSPIPYIALSYCWGSERTMVECDGQQMSISANCLAALKHVNRHFPERLVWADVLSIDQENSNEKSYQVSIMGHIFASAETVVVWLGEESEDIYNQLSELSGQSVGDEESLREQRIQLLKKLSQIQWFYRVWTFQEIRLAQKAIVLFGSQTMTWKDFISGIQGVRKLEPRLSTVVMQSESRHYVRFSYSPQDRFFSMLDELNAGTSNDLAGLLFLTWYRDATERRDKIYALLSNELLTTVRHGIIIDYKIPWSDLCIQSARASINTGQNLKILKIAGMMLRWQDARTQRWDPNEIPFLLQHPSWAPDWWNPPQKTRSHPSLIFDDRGCFSELNFCCSREPKLQDISDTSPFLTLNGIFLGLINLDQAPTYGGGPTLIHPAPRCVNINLGYLKHPTDPKIVVPKVSMPLFSEGINNHIRSSCFCVPFHQRQSQSGGRFGHTTSPFPFEGPKLSFEHNSFHVRDVARPKSKTEAELPAQVLGKSVESGDWLVLLEGGGMPFILRPARYTSGRLVSTQELSGGNGRQALPKDAGCFVLVGEASLCWDEFWPRQWDLYCRAGTFVLI